MKAFSTAGRSPPALDGQVAWVVGGIGVIGSGLVRGLLRAGATVIVNSRFPSRLEQLNDDLGSPEKIAGHTKSYEDRFANPFVAAERGFIDEVIQPRSTRVRVCRAFASLRNKKRALPWKKHDNIPL